MESVGAYEAKTHLPRLLDQVEQGTSIVITKHGRAVARLVPVGPRAADAATVIADIRTAREGASRGDLTVRDMIDEGRRP
ncbi:MAG: type II toxin-antitoxin system prevent-host-death family antitoxin [Frankiaceae bacterium]|nr:type II toxin-antitoxin system prevent-host-death family antitoxin [Frankiaceae bacterium]